MIEIIFLAVYIAALIALVIATEMLHYRTFNSTNKWLFNEFKRMNETLDEEIKSVEEQIKKQEEPR